MAEVGYLVPDRGCGDCTACCVHLAILEDDMDKLPGVTCQHCLLSGGCAIYASRPNVCRNYHCLWRRFDRMDDAWRPDKCGVMMIEHPAPDGYSGPFGVNLLVIGDPAILKSDMFASMVAGFIVRGTATFLDLPAGPGMLSRISILNDQLEPAIARRDLEAVKALIWQCYRELDATPAQPVSDAQKRGKME